MGYSSSHMNKELTPLGELIKFLKKENKQDGLLESYKYGLTVAIKKSTELLPKERKGYEDAFTAGDENWLAEVYHNNAFDYFTSKYISNE